MELVSLMMSLVLLILVARPWIGIIKSVLMNALKDGSSMLVVFVFQLMTSVPPMPMTVLALNATRDITFDTELVLEMKLDAQLISNESS